MAISRADKCLVDGGAESLQLLDVTAECMRLINARDIGPAATDEPAEYSIFYFNCADGTTVDFDLEIELYNVYNGRNNYLSGTARRPPWFCCGSCG